MGVHSCVHVCVGVGCAFRRACVCWGGVCLQGDAFSGSMTGYHRPVGDLFIYLF